MGLRWIWIQIRIRNTDFSDGMRIAVLFFTCCLLHGALTPVLHVEGSRTRPGIIVGSRYLFFLSSFFAAVATHLSFPTFAPLRLVAIVHHCSLFYSLVFAAIPHCFSSLLFVITFRHCFSSLIFVTTFRHYLSRSESIMVSVVNSEFICLLDPIPGPRQGPDVFIVKCVRYRISCIFVLEIVLKGIDQREKRWVKFGNIRLVSL